MYNRLALLLSCLLLFSAAAVLDFDWTIKEDYAVKFSTKKAEGTFNKLQGTVVFDPADLSTASFNVSVETATIETGNRTKNKHARSEKWLNAEEYPRISFVSRAFTTTGTNSYSVTGDLSIRGKIKSVTIPFEFTTTEQSGVFTGSVTVNRQDYEVTGPWLYGGLVGDEVKVDLRVPVEE